jgi:uncharacterized membrane protein
MACIDLTRGLVIVLMALDHVRDFVMLGSVQDPTLDPATSPLLFATRWITHFCAPVFVFLAGTSAGLMAARRAPADLAVFLMKRGVWLVLVEIVVISMAATFAPLGVEQMGGHIFIRMQVIWAIGASMIVLAGAQTLGRPACLMIGASIVLSHNLLDLVWPIGSKTDFTAPWWVMLHAQRAYQFGPFRVLFLYPLIPWVGVMLLGYGTAPLFEMPPAERNARLLRLGIGLTTTFLVVRGLDVYGDPRSWHFQPSAFAATAMSFLATTKYPPSLSYLLMTLGPAAIFCSVADRIGGKVETALVLFGRSPFAFYVLHLYLIHGVSVMLGVWQGFDAHQFQTLYAYFPKSYGLDIGGVYVTWIAVVVALFPVCGWIAAIKARRTDWWLSYL